MRRSGSRIPVFKYWAKSQKNHLECQSSIDNSMLVRIFQEAKRNPDATIEQIAEKVGCEVREVADTLRMFDM